MIDSYELVKVEGRRSPVRLRISRETDRALIGEVVNHEGDEVRIRKPFAIHVDKEYQFLDGGTLVETVTIIPLSMIEWRKPLTWDLKYGTLEIDRSGV